MRSRLTQYLAGLSVVFSPLLVAQTLTERVEVRVINVDAHVTDRAGNPYLGLTAADFEVLEDGRPQAITNFNIVEKTRMRPSPRADAQPTDARFYRRVAIVVDNNNLEKRDRDQALAIFEQFAEESIGPEAEWSVGFIGERFELIQPFTSDKAALKAALQKVRDTPVASSFTEQRRELLSDNVRRDQAKTGLDYKGTVAFANREQTYRAARAAVDTARGIVDGTRAYGQSAGKKVMFLISGGMQLNTTFSAYEKGTDSEVSNAKREVERLLEDLVQEANSANVSIDVITARTSKSPGRQFDLENSSAGFSRSSQPRQAEPAPGDSSSAHPRNPLTTAVMNDPIDTSDLDTANFKIANGTGGMYLTSNRVRDSFDAAEATSSQYYSLGYRPPHPEDGQYHQIAVRLKQPGYRIAHRQGYRDVSQEQELQELLKQRISALQPSTAVPVAVEVAPSTNAEGKPVVGVTASMPMKSVNLLAADDGKYAGKVHVYLSIFDAGGKNVAFQHLTQDVTIPADLREEALAKSFRYTLKVKIAPGEYTVAVTLRDDLSREVGTAVGTVKL